MNIGPEFISYQERINQFLAHCLSNPPPLSRRLYEAMSYAVLNGGKRLRPLFVYTLGTALGLPLQDLDHAACAIELIHAYSLIHDDLPSMDNDDWRRGKPSCHKQFGEAIALLAGDSLQTLAFDVLLKAPLDAVKIVKMLNVMVKAAGSWGMVAGQAMEFSGSDCLEKSNSEDIHSLKTGALFVAAFQLPAIIADLPAATLLTLKKVGNSIGLAFQIQDDVCDNENINFWQDAIERENYLKKLKDKVLADLESILTHSPSKNQSLMKLILALFKSKPLKKTIN
ncbi:MAG: polyprenyl synthetase family protein [Candidatus Aquirickettsiella sp.]